MQAYNKLWAALVGAAIVWVWKTYGVDLRGTEAVWVDLVVQIADTVVYLITPLLVWAIPNRPPRRPSGELFDDPDIGR